MSELQDKMDALLDHLLRDGVTHYRARNFPNVLAIVGEANKYRHHAHINPIFQHFDTLFILSTIEERIEPHSAISLFIQNIDMFGALFIKVVASYTDMVDFMWKMLHTGIHECFEEDQSLFEILIVRMVNETLYSYNVVNNKIFRVLQFWALMNSKYKEDTSFEEAGEPLLREVGTNTIITASKTWFSCGIRDFNKLSQLTHALSAFQIVIKLELLLAISTSREHTQLNISILYIAAIQLELYFDGDIHNWVDSSPIRWNALKSEQTAKTRDIWYKNASSALKKYQMDLGRFLMNSCLLLAHAEGQLGQVAAYRTYLAHYLIKKKDFDEAMKELRLACGIPPFHISKETVLEWKQLAANCYYEKQTRYALFLYENALRCCPPSDVTLRRDLCSNISLQYYNLEDFYRANGAAEECIRLDSNWYKGYLRLASAHFKLGYYSNCMSTLKNAFSLSHEKEEELFALLFKTRAMIGINKKDIKMNQRRFMNILKKLYEENSSESWNAIENLVMNFKNDVSCSYLSTMSLSKALQNGISSQFFEIIIQNGANVNEVSKDPSSYQNTVLKICLRKKLHQHTAILIYHGGLLEKFSFKSPPIIVATKLVIDRACQTSVLKIVLDRLSKSEMYGSDSDGDLASHLTCYGSATDEKLNVLKLLVELQFNFQKRNRHGRLPIELLQSKNDPRRQLIQKVYKFDRENGEIKRQRQDSASAKTAKEYKPYLDEKGKDMKALNNKDWRTAATAFNKRIKNMKKKVGNEKRNCETYVFSAVANLNVGNDKAAQVFKSLVRAYGFHADITKDALRFTCGERFDDILIGYLISNCIKNYSEDNFESGINGVNIIAKLIKDQQKLKDIEFVHTTIKFCMGEGTIGNITQSLSLGTESFVKELCLSWFGFSKRNFDKRKCDQAAISLVVELSKKIKDTETEALARLHLSMYNFAFNGAKDKARDHFQQATQVQNNSPQMLCDIWIKKVSELKDKNPQTAIFYCHVCVQLFLKRDFESKKFLQMMTDLAACLKRQKELSENNFKTFLLALQGIPIKDKNVAELLIETKKGIKQKKIVIIINRIAFEMTPEGSVDLKGSLCIELTKDCFNTERFDDCIKYAEIAQEVIPDNKDCYIWQAKALSKKKNLVSSRDILINAIKKFASMDDKKDLMIELYSMDIEPDWSSEDLQIDSQLLGHVVKSLINSSESSSWKILEKLALSLSDFSDILDDSIEIPLDRALSHEHIGEKFADMIMQRLHWRKVEEGFLVDKLIKKNFLDLVSQHIIRKGKDKRIMDAPIVLAIKLIISGKLKLNMVKMICQKLSENEFYATVKGAVQECCNGEYREVKKDIIKILFIKIEGQVKLGHELRKHLKLDDARYKLLDDYEQGHVEASKTTDSSKQKKKEKSLKEDEIKLDTSRNVDSDLMAAIQAVRLIKQKTSKEPGFKVLNNKKTAVVLEKSLERNKDGDAGPCVEMSTTEETIPDDKNGGGDNIKVIEDDDGDEEEDVDDGMEIDLENTSFEDTWEVECTQDVYRVLRSRKVPMKMKKKILEKIKTLASGEWPRDLQKKLEGVKEGITLYEAKINKSSRVIWEISISFSERRSVEQNISHFLDQVERSAIYEDKIRVWNIALHHDDVPKMIEKIEHSHDRGEDCILRKHLKGLKQKPSMHENQKHPNVYMNEEYVKEFINKSLENQDHHERRNFLFVPAASPNKEEYNILKFYSFTSQVASRILSVSNTTYDFPFQVSPLEYAVIKLEPKHRCAILLLGRSGTGKTTCCLYRLWSQYLNYWKTASLSGPQLPKFKPMPITEVTEESEENEVVELKPQKSQPNTTCDKDEKPKDEATLSDEESTKVGKIVEDCEHLRQILVTKNEVLCNEIRKNFKELSLGTQVTNYVELADIETGTIQEIEPEHYPLFITTKNLFLLLDNSLKGDKFFERDEEGNMKHDIPGWDKNKVHLSFLPSMGDEGDDEDEEDENLQTETKEDIWSKKIEHKTLKKREVTYEVFANKIWSKLIKKKGKGEKSCHPSLVWMEIKSFIKGSAEAFISEDKEGRLTGYLSKQEYLEIGRKRAPNFEGNREEIYDIFLRYLKLKSTSTYFDEMDVYFQLYKRLKATIIPDWAFHQIYLDETQDFTQAELLLLIRCSANPNAMFFTGDTAQSIMSGVAFRFCDLKSLYVVAKREFESLKLASPITVPSAVHQLTHNYRSHTGILRLSSTIVRLLELLFPASIDNAKPDIGLFPGPSPVILETDDFTELAILLQGSKRQTSAIEFGAHQVVLVQNEESKERLPAELSYGLVLSIYEAKGLEFDDVLLYNFFKDSPAYDEWRVVASNSDSIETNMSDTDCSLQVTYLPEDELKYDYRPLDFDYSKHKLLNSELKKLYTAVTRARVNVWIFDEDKKKRAPMFDFLVKKKLVDVAKLEDGVDRDYFVEQSTKEQWEKQGKYFFSKGLWKLAMKCARKAENLELKLKCEAKMQFVLAFEAGNEWRQKKFKTSLGSIQNGFKICALSFLNCGLLEDAEKSLKNASAHHLLALLYEKEKKFGDAAKHFKRAGFKELALRCYTYAKNHRSVMSLMKAENKYVDALRYQTENNLGDVDKIELTNKALEHYEKDSDFQSINNVLEFSNYAFQVAYLKEKEEMHFLLEELYKKHGRREELSRFYTQKKKFLEAAKLARSIDEKVRFMIMACKEFIVNGIQSVGSDLKEMFDAFVNDFKGIEDPIIKAEAFYCYTYLTKKPIYIVDAFKLFDFQIDNVGKLICLQLLIKQDYVNKSGVYLNTDRPYRNLEESIRAIFSLIEDLHQVSENKNLSMDTCLEKMGYHLVGRNYNVTDQASFNFYHNLANQEKSDQIHRRQITKTKAKATAAKILLNIVRRTISDFKGLVIQQVHVNSVCHMSERCENSVCNRLHQPPLRQNLSDAIKAIFYDLFIGGLCADAKEKLTKLDTIYSTYLWMNLSPNSLHMMYTLLQSYKPYLHIIRTEYFCEFFSLKHKNSKWYLKSIMRHEWDDSVTKKSININSYLGLSYVSYLIERNQPLIHELRISKKEKYYPFNLFDLHNESLVNLYFRSNIKRFFGTTFALLSNRISRINIGTLCDLLEVPILLLFTSISATSSSQHSYPYIVPANYLEHKDLWDTLYGPDGFRKAVSRLLRRSFQWEAFAAITKQLCDLLSNLDEVMSEFVKIPDYAKTNPPIVGQLSRMLCLYLVLFSNLKMPLWQYGQPVATLFRKSPQLQCNDFLSTIFNRMREIRSKEDAKAILVDLLKSWGDAIQQCEWSSKKKKLVKPGILQVDRPVTILKRETSKTDDESKYESSTEAIEDDDYYQKNDEDEEIDKKHEEEVQEMLKRREQDAKERALGIKFCHKWLSIVRQRHDRRKKCLQKLITYFAGLKIKYWMMAYYRKKCDNGMYFSEEIDQFDSKYFKSDGRCIACDVPDAKTCEHVESELHIQKVDLFDKYTTMKEEYEETFDLFVNLDVQDNAIDALSMRFKRQTFLLRHQKVPFPYNEELRTIVDGVIERYHILEAEHSRKLHEEANEFEAIESRKKRNLTKRGKK